MMRSYLRTPVARRAFAAAFVALALGSSPVQAHSPTIGASRGQFPDVPDQTVIYGWGGTYPSWMSAAAQDSLDTKYRSWNDNNSRAPRPVYGSGATAVVYYAALKDSPCNSVTSLQWLQCATGFGTRYFRIYIRDLDKAPYSDWRWWDKAGTCLKSTGVAASGCWYIRRAMIHEAGHALATFGHDSQTEADTVMRSVAPVVGATGGNHFVFQRCDQAALQILWDVKDASRPYGDCFDHVAGHGVRGLVTAVTTNGTSFGSCVSAGRLVGGRLAVKIEALYGRLSNNPIAGRTLWFDRKKRTDTTWTLRTDSTLPTGAETGTNWTRTFSAPASAGGTYDYRAHFDGDAGLDPSNYGAFSISWTAGC